MTIKDVNHVVVKLIVTVELMVAVVRVGAKEQEEAILLNHIKLCLEIMLCFFKFMQILGRKIQYGRRQSPSKFRSTAEMRNDKTSISDRYPKQKNVQRMNNLQHMNIITRF